MVSVERDMERLMRPILRGRPAIRLPGQVCMSNRIKPVCCERQEWNRARLFTESQRRVDGSFGARCWVSRRSELESLFFKFGGWGGR